MRGSDRFFDMFQLGRQVRTPNGMGVIAGMRIDGKRILVLVDHGERGPGGMVNLTAYPARAFKKVKA